jgi:hypothetical protein
MRSEPAGDSEADNPGATIDHGPRFSDRRRELGCQIAAIAAANDVYAGARGDTGFKSQPNNDDQEFTPHVNGKSKHEGNRVTANECRRT